MSVLMCIQVVKFFIFCLCSIFFTFYFSARPGRPPKRSPSIHASPDTLEKLKKSRLDTDFQYDPRIFGKC